MTVCQLSLYANSAEELKSASLGAWSGAIAAAYSEVSRVVCSYCPISRMKLFELNAQVARRRSMCAVNRRPEPRLGSSTSSQRRLALGRSSRGSLMRTMPLAVADLGDEPVVGAELGAEVLALQVPVGVRGAVRPRHLQRVVRERPSVPLGLEVGTVRGVALAEQRLAGERVRTARAPLEVRPRDPGVPSALDVAAGGEQAHERAPEVVPHAEDTDVGGVVLGGERRALRSGDDHQAAAAVLGDEGGVGGLPDLPGGAYSRTR